MSVFISYQRADESAAAAVATRFTTRGVPYYFDLRDSALTASADQTRAIMAGLARCTHLLAVVSATTSSSWWVPFEIGVASKSEQRITSLRRGAVQLPHFLSIWPVLSFEQIDLFIERYFQDTRTERGYKTYGLREAITKSIASADSFHSRLKADLGQR